jgi:hypothetical protein
LADSASEATRHLNEASKYVSVGDIPLLLQSLWWLGSNQPLSEQLADRQNVVHRWMRNQVVDAPERLVAALRDRNFRVQRSDRLHAFLVSLGIPQSVQPASTENSSEWDAAWRAWPPLGWMLETRKLLEGDPGSLRRARRTMGVDELLTQQQNGNGRFSDFTMMEWRDLRSDNDMFGGRIQDHEVSLPVQILRQQQHELNATLRGHFDDENSWLAVNFDWLIDQKNASELQTNAGSDLLDYRKTLRAGIEELLEERRIPKAAAEGLLNRFDPRPDARLTHIPFCVGATAIIQRAYAVYGISLPFTGPEDLLRCGVASFGVAQRLYERDLCLASMAIAQNETSDQHVN